MVNRVGIFLVLVLFLGFNVNLIGADGGNGSLNEVDSVVDVPVEDVGVVYEVDEDVGLVVNESEEVELAVNESEYVELVVNESEEVELVVNKSANKTINDSSAEIDNRNNSLGDLDEFKYVDIDELTKSVSDINEDEDIFISNEKVSKELVKDGRVELEFEVLEGDDIEIIKKEFSRSDTEKDVLISSSEHFEDEVLVYSDLPSEVESRVEVVVNWENEGEVVSEVEYFDTDDNGLIDRISWVVPHLSTQHYNIEIVVEVDGTNDVLGLNVNAPINGTTVSNPVKFDFNINYSHLNDVECKLSIDEDVIYLFGIDGENNTDPKILENGTHYWNVYCEDINNDSINNKMGGYFDVSDFSISPLDDFYFNNDAITVTVNYDGNYSLKLMRGEVVVAQNITHPSSNHFDIGISLISVPGKYKLITSTNDSGEVISVSDSFTVGKIDVGFDSNVKENEDVIFAIKGYDVPLFTYDLYVGDDKISATYGNQTIVEKFDSGSYLIHLKNIKVGENYFPDMDFGMLNVNSSISNSAPYVTLIFPDWKEKVNSSVITFKYRVEDDGLIKNCTLNIYNSTKDFSGYSDDDLIFPLSSSDKNLATKKNLKNDEEFSLKLIDFDEGYYVYDVVCYDDEGKMGDNINYFSVDLNGSFVVSEEEANYGRKAEVENLIGKINSFLEKEDDFGVEERRVLSILGLDSEMVFYKKRIVQMDQDLKYNLKFMEASKRAKRIREIYSELDDIEDSVILDVRSVDSYEFSKGSVDLDLEEVIGNYMSESGTSMRKGSLKSLVNYNEGLQKSMAVSVEAWKLEIEYLDDTKEIVLVSKNLDIEGGDNLKVLEVIPSDFVEDMHLVSKAEDIGEGIYSVDTNDLEDGNFVYYFDKGFDLKKVEKMESILFGEGVGSGASGITGMFIGVGNGISFGSFFWLPLFLFIGYVGFLGYGRVRLEGWKKEPGVEELVRLINDTILLIKRDNISVARDNYRKMGEIYKALPLKCRDFFYVEIKRVRLAIDKKDVLGLIKEYEKAKDEFRKDDAVMLHGKINLIYRKLPKKFQEKVYQRLIKKEV